MSHRDSSNHVGLPGGGKAIVGRSTVVATNVSLDVAEAEQAGSQHWKDEQIQIFASVELDRRHVNRCAVRMIRGEESRTKYDLFISHSLRNSGTQLTKRRILNELSRIREVGCTI